MIWAAGVDAALSLVGDGELGGHPVGVVIAAGLAVAGEFALLRGRPRPRRPGGPQVARQPLWRRPRSRRPPRPDRLSRPDSVGFPFP